MGVSAGGLFNFYRIIHSSIQYNDADSKEASGRRPDQSSDSVFFVQATKDKNDPVDSSVLENSTLRNTRNFNNLRTLYPGEVNFVMPTCRRFGHFCCPIQQEQRSTTTPSHR